MPSIYRLPVVGMAHLGTGQSHCSVDAVDAGAALQAVALGLTAL